MGMFLGVAKVSNIFGVLDIPDIILGKQYSGGSRTTNAGSFWYADTRTVTYRSKRLNEHITLTWAVGLMISEKTPGA